MRALLIPCAAFLFFSACSSSSKKDTSEGESQVIDTIDVKANNPSTALEGDEMPISSTPSETQGFNVIGNQRYNFNIDIPSHWRAVDISDDGDGFTVTIPENNSVSISVYGEKYDELLQDFYEEDCNETAEFTFVEEKLGKRCIGEDEVSYWLISSEHKLNVHVKGWSNLSLADKTNLTTMVRSMRTDQPQPEA